MEADFNLNVLCCVSIVQFLIILMVLAIYFALYIQSIKTLHKAKCNCDCITTTNSFKLNVNISPRLNFADNKQLSDVLGS